MAILSSPELMAALVDPETRRPVHLASDDELRGLRAAISRGGARRRDGGEVPTPFDTAFVTDDRRRAFLVIDGVPNFLVEESVELDEAL